MPNDRTHAMDHVVVVLFENRSLDNVLGRLYGPNDGKTFDGVIGKNLSNPIRGRSGAQYIRQGHRSRPDRRCKEDGGAVTVRT